MEPSRAMTYLQFSSKKSGAPLEYTLISLSVPVLPSYETTIDPFFLDDVNGMTAWIFSFVSSLILSMQNAVFRELMKNLNIPCSVTLPFVTYSEVTLSSEPSFFSILAELFQKIPSTKISQIVYPSLETLS